MFEITKDQTNRDAVLSAKDYLKMLDGFESRLADPIVKHVHDYSIFRGDLSQTSLKGYGAEPLMASIGADTVVYVAPRAGAAPDAIAKVASIYGKRCVFFCPASKVPSPHQRSVLNYPNVELRFVKIAAMPVLNSYAEKWAEQNGAKFLPFGLAKSPLVTAGLILTAQRMRLNPSQVWMSVSTGTAIRAFEIAWPYAEIKGVAVARNMHPGEIGKADLVSSSIPFLRPIKDLPPFPSTSNYDAKAWKRFRDEHKPGALFVNVSCDANIMKPYPGHINSQREWGDHSDLERPLQW